MGTAGIGNIQQAAGQGVAAQGGGEEQRDEGHQTNQQPMKQPSAHPANPAAALRSPSSTLTTGRQPSSSRALPASI